MFWPVYWSLVGLVGPDLLHTACIQAVWLSLLPSILYPISRCSSSEVAPPEFWFCLRKSLDYTLLFNCKCLEIILLWFGAIYIYKTELNAGISIVRKCCFSTLCTNMSLKPKQNILHPLSNDIHLKKRVYMFFLVALTVFHEMALTQQTWQETLLSDPVCVCEAGVTRVVFTTHFVNPHIIIT